MSIDTATKAQVGLKRINFIVSSNSHRELTKLSERCNQSMTVLLQLGLGLVRLALDAKEKGERLVIVGADGHPTREIVLPLG